MLHHRYLVGLAFIPHHRDPMVHAGGGARGQNLVHIQKVGFLRFRKISYLRHRYLVEYAFIPQHRTPGSMWGGGGGWMSKCSTYIKKIGFLR